MKPLRFLHTQAAIVSAWQAPTWQASMNPIHNKLQTRNPDAATWMLTTLCALLVVHLSLYPYTGWRDIGVGAVEFLHGAWVPLHQRLLWADIGINVLGYAPLGFLLSMALLQRKWGAWSVLAVAWCAALSMGMEAIQTYLPSRVPSKMDLLTNTVGALVGYLLAWGWTQRAGPQWGVAQQLDVWLVQKAWLGMGLLALWLFSLLAPQHPDYVTGYWLGNALSSLGLGPEQWLENLLPDQLIWIEQHAPGLSNYCFLACAWMLGLAQTQARAPRVRLLTLLVLLSVGLRWLYNALDAPSQSVGAVALFMLQENQVALTLAWCVSAFVALGRLPAHWAARLAFVHLVAGWLLTLLLPGFTDPVAAPQTALFAKTVMSLGAAAQAVSEVWPLLALGVLLFLSKPEHHFAR